MHVALFSSAPAFHDALRIFDHGLRVCRDARTVKGRLHQAPLPQPEIPFAGEQPFPKNVPVRPQHAALEVAAWMTDQHLFNEVGVIDENVAKIDDADADDVAVARQFRKHLQRALAQCTEGPALETGVGAGREFVAAEPHRSMLTAGLVGVKAGEFCRGKYYFARTARIRKPPLRESRVTFESPEAINLLTAVAGSRGTNVLLMWPTR